MNFIDDKISEYAEAHSSPESDLLNRLNRDTNSNVLIPRMLSGHLQGRILSVLSRMKRPKYILEIGTYTGYSALCLAEGLKKKGELHTIDRNEELETRVRKYFSESEDAHKLHLHIGNALDLIPALDRDWDLVFIDADKENYSAYYDLLINDLPKGAVIIADNVLWSAKVIDENQRLNDMETKALHAFNEKVTNDPRVENALMPVRDGLMVLVKRRD